MRTTTRVCLAIGAGLLVAALVLVGARITQQDVGAFTRDPNQLGGNPPWFGSVSILTCVLWGAAAALSLFVAAVGASSRRALLRRFAALNLLLLADDTLMLHESVGPSHGVREEAFYLFYAALGLALLRWSWHHRRTGFAVELLLGGSFLAGSVLLDLGVQTFGHVVPGEHLVEDGLKLIGAFLFVAVPTSAWVAPGATEVDAPGARVSQPTERTTGAHGQGVGSA